MALETVLISRSVTFDPSIQREVSKDLERFAALGFSVYRQVGEIVTIPEVRDVVPSPDKERVSVAADAVASIREKHGLSHERIAALVGCNAASVQRWLRKESTISEENYRKLMKIMRRSNALDAGSSQLRDEAKGAVRVVRARARQASTGKRKTITDSQKAEILSLRKSGKTLREIARAFEISETAVFRACMNVGPKRNKISDDQKIEIASLRESGKSLYEIADLFGVSTSRVWQICKELA